MNRRRYPVLVSLLSAVLLVGLAGCGGGSTTSGPTLYKPTPGRVVPLTPQNTFLSLPRSVIQEKNGDYLVDDAGNYDRTGGKVELFSHAGKPLWVYTGGLVFPHAAYPLQNGNIVIADTGNDRVIEVNKAGKIVWNTDNFGGGKGYLGNGKLSNGVRLKYPNDAYPLANGNLLISSRFTNAVYEVNNTGKVVWQCARFMDRQHNPRFLSNGDLIVADSDAAKVEIINHACTKVVFSYGPGLPLAPQIIWPRSFQPYGANDYVIGDSEGVPPRVIEINKQKKVVQQWTNLPSPFYLTVQSDGSILTQDSNIHGIISLNPDGSVTPVITTKDPNSYPSAVVNPGFENTGPVGWHRGDLLTESLPAGVRADMKFDTSTAHTGKSSGMISWPTNTSHLGVFWYETLDVKPGHTYDFTGWMKTSKVEPCNGCDHGPGTPNTGSADFYIAYDGSGIHTPTTPGFAPGLPAIGTQNWQEYTSELTIPMGIHQVTIQCNLNGWGTVWFDDVTLKDEGMG